MAHPDANIIFGAVIDDEMGDDVRVTVIAAGFERWDGPSGAGAVGGGSARPSLSTDGDPLGDDLEIADVFADSEPDGSSDDDGDGPDDEFDVPSFLR